MPRHVGDPELFALESPRLAIHLPPLRSGLDRDFDAAKIDPATLAAGRAALVFRLLAGFQHPQPLAAR